MVRGINKISVDPKCREFDGGYAGGIFPHLKAGKEHKSFGEVFNIIQDFFSVHGRVVGYSSNLDGVWTPINYAYEGVRVLASPSFYSTGQGNGGDCVVVGKAYHVTRNDGSLVNGDITSVLWLDKNLKQSVTPLILEGGYERNVKGIDFTQNYANNRRNFGIVRFIGVNFGDVEMPRFSEGRFVKGVWQEG